MGRNKYIQCEVCRKSLRRDKIKLHIHRHEVERKNRHPMKICPTCNVSMIAWNLPRHQKIHQKSSATILENIKVDQLRYEDTKTVGQIVENVMLLDKYNIDPMSLRKEYVKALDVNSHKTNKNDGTVLRPWQQQLLDFIAPSDREIIWVIGQKGAEGKSWFQEYMINYYGSMRVFHSTLNKHSDGILHTLTKKSVSLIDVFIFNMPRSFAVENVPYTLLEEIKDGQAISSKYDSKILRFKTPNIVAVFSNELPTTIEMSTDRWKIFKINDDDLLFKITPIEMSDGRCKIFNIKGNYKLLKN